jgi:uncharacterized protein with PIN domain
MSRATFRFYEELNDFLPAEDRKRSIPFDFDVAPTVKDAVESLGVPHVEIDLIVVNEESVGFAYRLGDGDRVAVYPVFESIDISPVIRLGPKPLRAPAFVADVHLRKLARYLRLLGLDTRHAPDLDDGEIIDLAARERRIILTRDRQLLKHGAVTHGTWIRSTEPIEQAREVVRRFDLMGQVRPFTRCPSCNGRLAPAEKEDVLERIPPRTAAWLDDYRECTSCGKLYWRGTHVGRLEELVRRILHAGELPSSDEP